MLLVPKNQKGEMWALRENLGVKNVPFFNFFSSSIIPICDFFVLMYWQEIKSLA
jgi:hypothetical protein